MTGKDVRMKRNIRLRTQKCENVCKKYMKIYINYIDIYHCQPFDEAIKNRDW